MTPTRIRIIIGVVAGFVGVLGAGRPAFAQIASGSDIAGSWMPFAHEDFVDRIPGPEPLDWTGLPLSDEGRKVGLSYSVSRNSTIERQCALHPPQYLVLGPFGIRITAETDPFTGATVAWHVGAWEDRAPTTIWMDGRPHPSDNAPHTRGGFETGKWLGNTLTTHTTHIKAGIIRRNGVQVSDQVTLTTHYIRNGDLMTVLMFIDDPVNLTEPHAISKDFRLQQETTLDSTGPPCIITYEGTDSNSVAHYLPGKNPLTGELFKTYGIPREAALGGAETMYPEYRKKLKAAYVRPEKCPHNCGGLPGGPPGGFPGGPRGGGPPGAPPPPPR